MRSRRSNNHWVWVGPVGLVSYGVYLKAGWAVAVPVALVLVAVVILFVRRELRRREEP